MGSWGDFSTGDLLVSLHYRSRMSIGSVSFSNFGHSDPAAGDFPVSGEYTSAVYDCGRATEMGKLSFTESVPAGGDVQLQLAFSDSPDGPWTYKGPDGNAEAWYTIPGGQAVTGPGGNAVKAQYVRYRARLTSGSDGDSAGLSEVHLSYAGTNESELREYQWDPAGNRTALTITRDTGLYRRETLDDPSWSAADRISSTNQIKRRDVFDGTNTVTWRYTYNSDGEMTSKTDGVDIWTHEWSLDGRLTGVKKNNVYQATYEYDSVGRMIRRVKGAEQTVFHWDRVQLVGEIQDDGLTSTKTRYYVTQGQLRSFERDGSLYQVHASPLGHVHAVTDANGAVTAQFQSDSWGNQLSSSVDNVPGELSHRFSGAYGVRWDGANELYYARQRWYDPALGKFVSRDSMYYANRYTYAGNNPASYSDPSGLDKYYGANPEAQYGRPTSALFPWDRDPTRDHPIWVPSENPPAFDPHYAAHFLSADDPYMTVPGGLNQKDVWDLLESQADCPTGKQCFLICTRDTGIAYNGRQTRHAFLAFGPDRGDVFGLWQGNVGLGPSPWLQAKISWWNATLFGRRCSGLGVR